MKAGRLVGRFAALLGMSFDLNTSDLQRHQFQMTGSSNGSFSRRKLIMEPC
jgi:hypothetical protein